MSIGNNRQLSPTLSQLDPEISVPLSGRLYMASIALFLPIAILEASMVAKTPQKRCVGSQPPAAFAPAPSCSGRNRPAAAPHVASIGPLVQKSQSGQATGLIGVLDEHRF